MNTIIIYLCKLITQYTFTCLHSIAMETESTLVDIIARSVCILFSVIMFHVCTKMPRRRLSKPVSGQSVSL